MRALEHIYTCSDIWRYVNIVVALVLLNETVRNHGSSSKDLHKTISPIA